MKSTIELVLSRWPDALLDPGRSVAVDLHGLPGLFHAPPGWSVAAPGLPTNLLYYVVTGAFNAQIRGRRLRAAEGSVLWVAAGEAFRFQRMGPEPLVLLRFRLGLMAGDACCRPAEPWLHRAHCREARGWFEKIVLETARPDAYEQARLRSLLACLVVELIRYDRPSAGPRLLDDAQRRALETYVVKHTADWPTLAELADVVSLSPDYFSRVFRRTFGVTPRPWLVTQRIRVAKLYLVESDRTIAEVADLLGYNDVFYFSRQFKEQVGQSPTRFRQQVCEPSSP